MWGYQALIASHQVSRVCVGYAVADIYMDKLNSDTSRYEEVVDHSAPASFLIPGTDEIEQSRDHGCKQDFRLRPGFSQAGRRDHGAVAGPEKTPSIMRRPVDS